MRGSTFGESPTCPVLVVKGEAPPLRRIILATDGSEASAKALKFVLSTFQPDRSISKGRRVPIHVSVVHVIAPRPLAPIDVGTTIPWIKQRGGLKVKETGRRLVEQSAQKLSEAGFTAEAFCRLGNPAEKDHESGLSTACRSDHDGSQMAGRH